MCRAPRERWLWVNFPAGHDPRDGVCWNGRGDAVVRRNRRGDAVRVPPLRSHVERLVGHDLRHG
eukprot:5369325-Pyramimonas_sp.AAC.1